MSEPVCGWCLGGREPNRGCCGRTGWHHHTTVVTDAVRNEVRLIPSDDCTRLPPEPAPHSEDRIEEAAREIARMIAEPCQAHPSCQAGDRWKDCPYAVTARDVERRGVAILQRLYDDGGSYWKHKHDNLEGYAVQLREDYAKLRAERDAAYDDGKKAGREEVQRGRAKL